MTFHRVNLSAAVHDLLRENILGGRLPEGLVLEAAPLAKALKVSRTPVVSAMRSLADQKLIREGTGRGFIVGSNGTPFRRPIEETDLLVSAEFKERITRRNWRSISSENVEQEIAACLLVGRFVINASRMAAYYGVSRTLAHEILVRLERLGIVEQRESRWFVGPLTREDLYNHYEMRWVLEPLALASAVPYISPAMIDERRARVRQVLSSPGGMTMGDLINLEKDIHTDLVLRTPNSQMVETIRRSQLILIPTNLPLQNYKGQEILMRGAVEHLIILDRLAKNDIPGAQNALEHHIRQALETTSDIINAHTTTWTAPPYMTRED